MLKENEVIMLILGFALFFIIIFNRVHIEKIISWKILFISYCILLAGWLFTVLEGFIFENFFNVFEHISYALSMILLVIWCWKYTDNVKGGKYHERDSFN